MSAAIEVYWSNVGLVRKIPLTHSTRKHEEKLQKNNDKSGYLWVYATFNKFLVEKWQSNNLKVYETTWADVWSGETWNHTELTSPYKANIFFCNSLAIIGEKRWGKSHQIIADLLFGRLGEGNRNFQNFILSPTLALKTQN